MYRRVFEVNNWKSVNELSGYLNGWISNIVDKRELVLFRIAKTSNIILADRS